MPEHSARYVAELVRQVQHDDEWPEIWSLRDALSSAEKDRLLHALFDQLQATDHDDEKQTRILDLMLTTDHANALPYLRTALQIVTSSFVKCHLCWILEGNADASFIDGLGHLALHDRDPLVRSFALLSLAFISNPRIVPILQYLAAHDEGVCNGQRLRDVAQKILYERHYGT